MVSSHNKPERYYLEYDKATDRFILQFGDFAAVHMTDDQRRLLIEDLRAIEGNRNAERP